MRGPPCDVAFDLCGGQGLANSFLVITVVGEYEEEKSK